MADAIRLDGKIAIITGGAGGIGAATARLMTARGARVAVADIALEPAQALAAELPGALAVAPGMTMTPALKEAFPPALRQVVEDETLRDQLGDPEDIAETVAFLASPAARNITAQVLVSDGGCASHVPGIAGFRAFFEGHQ